MARGQGKGSGKDAGGMDLEGFHLWKAFTRDIEPLEGEPDWEALEKSLDPAPSKTSGQRPPSKDIVAPSITVPVPAKKSPPQAPQLDARTELRLRRGQMPIEGTLDLHGYNQDQAHRMLHDFVVSAHGRGKRCVLVITGKGRGNGTIEAMYAFDKEPGILKQKLPVWLSLPPLRDIVLKAFIAAPKHGGSGAWYLYLRRERDYTG